MEETFIVGWAGDPTARKPSRRSLKTDRIGRRYFRDHLIAAPLKPSLRMARLRASAYFRDHLIAAPLKLSKPQLQGIEAPHFRDHLIAAPLKRCGSNGQGTRGQIISAII